MKKPNKLTLGLIEIFKSVADACDGGFDDEAIKIIERDYNAFMATPEGSKLYRDLIEARHLEVFEIKS